MIKKINEKWTITIPVFSFITVFSSAFLNRQKQISYVTNTALFNKEFTVELYQFAKFIYSVSKNRKKRFKICFIAPDYEIWSKLNGDLPHNFILHSIDFEFLSIDDISSWMMNGVSDERDTIFIFSGFNNWHSVTATIHSITLKKGDQGVVISGGDSSKRHLVSPLSIKLHTFLLIITHFNRDILVNNVLFNIEKKFIIPQFNFQEVNHRSLPMKIIDSVDKNKRNKNSRNLYTDFHIENVSSEIEQSNEHSPSEEEKQGEEESIANSTILPIPSTKQRESLANTEDKEFPATHPLGLGISEDSNNVTSKPSEGETRNNLSLDPNQKRNYHMSTYIRSNSSVCVKSERFISLSKLPVTSDSRRYFSSTGSTSSTSSAGSTRQEVITIDSNNFELDSTMKYKSGLSISIFKKL